MPYTYKPNAEVKLSAREERPHPRPRLPSHLTRVHRFVKPCSFRRTRPLLLSTLSSPRLVRLVLPFSLLFLAFVIAPFCFNVPTGFLDFLSFSLPFVFHLLQRISSSLRFSQSNFFWSRVVEVPKKLHVGKIPRRTLRKFFCNV